MSAEPAEQRLAVAAAAGAFACTTLGDWEGMPTRDDLDALGRSDNVDR
jgi:2-dehydro-3-deoxygluconokinase